MIDQESATSGRLEAQKEDDMPDRMRTSFEEKGYVILRKHYPIALLEHFTEAASTVAFAFAARVGVEENMLDKAVLALPSLGELYDTWSQLPEMLRIQGYPGTASEIRRVAFDSPLYNFKGRCLIQPPGDERRTYNWHQQTFYGLPKCRFVQTWAPLIRNVTRENGTIWLCPGSHKYGPLPAMWSSPEGRADQITVHPDVVDRFEQIQVEMELGDLLIFDGALVHKSGENKSSKVRYSLVGEFYDATDESFHPVVPEFKYRGTTPREYFDSVPTLPGSERPMPGPWSAL